MTAATASRGAAASLSSKGVKLNGRLLQLVASGGGGGPEADDLPPLDGVHVVPAAHGHGASSATVMELAGLSYGFVLFGEADVAACGGRGRGPAGA